MACAGTVNLYTIYLNDIKTHFRLDITGVNLFASFVNIGLWVALPVGTFYDRFGGRTSCFLAAFFFCIYYISMFVIFTYNLSVNLNILLLLAIFKGQASALCIIVSYSTCLKLFSKTYVALLVSSLSVNFSLVPSYGSSFIDNFPNVSRQLFFLCILTFVLSSLLFVIFNIERKEEYTKCLNNKISRLYQRSTQHF